MESFRIYALLCFISGFSLVIEAQDSHALRSRPLCDHDTYFGQKNGLGSFGMINVPMIPNSVYFSTKRNYNELLMSALSHRGIRLTVIPHCTEDCGGRVTFNSKWESLTGKPIIDNTHSYYSPVKSTSKRTLSDNDFYRTGATIVNFVMYAKYPYVNRPK